MCRWEGERQEEEEEEEDPQSTTLALVPANYYTSMP